jgi:arylsulfatase A-like enzyme
MYFKIINCSSDKDRSLYMSAKPNVIYVFSDQHRYVSCGFAGNDDVHTPNLDLLATESINFDNMYSGMPVCCPYRASLMTGMYPNHHGIFLNDLLLPTNLQCIADVYKKNGYDTAYIGKWHLDGDKRKAYIPKNRRRGFDYWKVMECEHSYNHSQYFDGTNRTMKMWDGYDAIAQTKDAIIYLKNRKQEKPLFLMLSWGPPHPPYNSAPEEFKNLYNLKTLHKRDNVPIEAGRFHRDLPGYYAHISAIDSCIGMLRKAIDECNMRSNTIFIYTSDHGDMLGSQGVYEKQSPWDESIHVPFLMRYPFKYGDKGSYMHTPMGAADIMPTLLSLCDLPVPDTVDGTDYSSYLNNKSCVDKDILLQCIQPNGTWNKNNGGREYRGIRSQRYTYVEDLHGPWLLYDNETDPMQMDNLLNQLSVSSKNQNEISQLKDQLHKRLYKKLKEAGDEFRPGLFYLKKWNYTDKLNFLDTVKFHMN